MEGCWGRGEEGERGGIGERFPQLTLTQGSSGRPLLLLTEWNRSAHSNEEGEGPVEEGNRKEGSELPHPRTPCQR